MADGSCHPVRVSHRAGVGDKGDHPSGATGGDWLMLAGWWSALRQWRLRWVPPGHRVVDPSDPDLRLLASVGHALGLRFDFVLRPRWLGPWVLIDNEWVRPFQWKGCRAWQRVPFDALTDRAGGADLEPSHPQPNGSRVVEG